MSTPRGIPQAPRRIAFGRYETPSWAEVGRSYTQDLDARSCTCYAFSGERSQAKGQPCKHLVNAFLASFFEMLDRARGADTAVLLHLLDSHRWEDRPDVKNAMLAILWERSQGLATPPGPEPLNGMDAGELHTEFELDRELQAQADAAAKPGARAVGGFA